MNIRNQFLKTKKLEQGFSLIEVLIALTIVGISLIVLLQIFSGGMHRVESSEEAYKAALFAQSLEARLGKDLPLQPGSQRGETAQGFEWVIDITPYDTRNENIIVHAPRGQLYDINIHVTWHSAIRVKELSLGSLRYGEKEPL